MQQFLANKHVILGVTGGIAAYKSAELVRRLREMGAEVRVVMTAHAKEFITPLTMQAVSGHPIHDELFDLNAEAAMGHIELARWADVIVVAPATADFMARLLQGEAGDLLTTLCLAAKAPIAVVPAMNQAMWKNTATQANAQALHLKGIHIFGPAEGSQACGDVGPGRMLEPLDILERLAKLFSTNKLAGKKVVITAGPTREAIDPVRYLSNGSSGKMGYALAQAAVEAGANVTLISGPVNLPRPSRVQVIDVVSAEEMLAASLTAAEHCDIFIGVAAVADQRCKQIATQKMPKSALTSTLELEPTPDIIAHITALTPRPFVVGFAAETHDIVQKAQVKLAHKNLDLIIANQVGEGQGIGSDDNAVTVIGQHVQQEYPLMSKHKLAHELIEFISRQLR